VNAIAAFIVRLMSPLFRAAQTGFAQNYALVMVLGLVAAVAVVFRRRHRQSCQEHFRVGTLKIGPWSVVSSQLQAGYWVNRRGCDA